MTNYILWILLGCVVGFSKEGLASSSLPPLSTATTAAATPPPTATASHSLPLSDCQDYVGNGFQCSFVAGICDDAIGYIVCRKYCGICQSNATDQPINYDPSDCRDHMTGLVTCNLLGVCDSKAKFFCPSYCKLCDSQPSTCTDHLVHGSTCKDSPYICDSPYGKVVCPRTCGLCAGPPPSDVTMTTASSGTCQDHVSKGLTCQQLTGVCGDPSGIGNDILCPRFCGVCHDPTTTQAALECRDHLTNGVQCSSIDGVCDNLYGHIACKSFCDVCQGSSPTTSGWTPTPGGCQDNVGHGLTCQELPGVCSDHQHIGPDILCPRFCAICEDPTTTTEATTTTTTEAATAVLTEMTSFTDMTSTTTMTSQPPCRDFLTGHACENLEKTFTTLCSDPNGQTTCAKYCGFCTVATTPDPTMEMDNTQSLMTDTHPTHPAHTPACEDLEDKGLCELPEFCQDRYAPALCRKTCGFCQEGCHDTVNCTELLGDSGMFSSLSELCQDAERAAVCRFTCGCPE